MQRSSDSWHKNTKGVDSIPLKRDVDTNMPSRPYLKQAPIYASIDDIDNGGAEQKSGSGSRPGSGRVMESRQRDMEQRQRDREQRQKLSSRSAAGYDMEQRHSSMGSRPFTKYDLQQRRLEMERRPNSGYKIEPRPGSGRDVDRSQGQRRAQTFSHPHAQVHQRQGSLGSQHDQRGGTSGPVTSTGQSLNTSINAGYPSAKFGKDFYVIDV